MVKLSKPERQEPYPVEIPRVAEGGRSSPQGAPGAKRSRPQKMKSGQNEVRCGKPRSRSRAVHQKCKILEPYVLQCIGVLRGFIFMDYQKHYLLNQALWQALKRQDIPCVKSLLREGADPNMRGPQDYFPLYQAVVQPSRELISILLEAGALIGLTDWEGGTALHYAVTCRDASLVEHLLREGLDPNARDSDGETPLFIAVRKKRLECVRFLLDYGANPTIKNYDKETVFSFLGTDDGDEVIQAALTAVLERNLLARTATSDARTTEAQPLHL